MQASTAPPFSGPPSPSSVHWPTLHLARDRLTPEHPRAAPAMPLHARGTAMLVMRHMGVASDRVRRFQKTCFGEGEAVDVH